MPPKRPYKTCEICGNQASRTNQDKRMFMARFPSDEARCKQWVKFVGKEDLIYVPLEKLHTLKYVCGDHFQDGAFNKKKNRLKRSAIPSKNLKADPLPDEMLLEFPCHIYSNIDVTTPYNSEGTNNNEAALCQAGPSKSDPLLTQGHTYCIKKKHEDHSYFKEWGIFDNEQPTQENSVADNKETAIAEDDLESIKDCEDEPIHCDDEDVIYTENPEKEATINEDTEIFDQTHRWFKCNVCLGEISGFRYVCVQCSDYDMCARCEARGEHPHHYVLRVPSKAHNSESRAVLHSLRRFFRDLPPAHPAAGLTPSHLLTVDIKEEIVEVKDENEVNLVELEPNPLGDDSLEEHMLEDDASEDYPIDDNILENYEIEPVENESRDVLIEVPVIELPSVGKRTRPPRTQCYPPAKKIKLTNSGGTSTSLESQKHFNLRSSPILVHVENVVALGGTSTKMRVGPQETSVRLIQRPIKTYHRSGKSKEHNTNEC